MENNGTSRKAAVLVVVVFLLGIALGGLGTRLWGDRVFGARLEGHNHSKIVERLTRELDLTADQKKQLETILQDTWGKFDSIYEQVRPQYDEARKQGRERIRAILTPEQLPKFEEFVRHMDEERQKREQHR